MKIGKIQEVKVPVQVVLGETELTVSELSTLYAGRIIELKQFAGEPVDLVATGEKIAKGEVVIIDESFGIRITSLVGEGE